MDTQAKACGYKKPSREACTSGRVKLMPCVLRFSYLAEVHHDEIFFTTVRGINIDHIRKDGTAAIIQLNPQLILARDGSIGDIKR